MNEKQEPRVIMLNGLNDISMDGKAVKGRPITATDPRKKLIMQNLKDKTGCERVTIVKEITKGVFTGHCLKQHYDGHWVSLGFHATTL